MDTEAIDTVRQGMKLSWSKLAYLLMRLHLSKISKQRVIETTRYLSL